MQNIHLLKKREIVLHMSTLEAASPLPGAINHPQAVGLVSMVQPQGATATAYTHGSASGAVQTAPD